MEAFCRKMGVGGRMSSEIAAEAAAVMPSRGENEALSSSGEMRLAAQ